MYTLFTLQTNSFSVAIFFPLGCKFPHIAGLWCDIELEARQVRHFLHEVHDFVKMKLLYQLFCLIFTQMSLVILIYIKWFEWHDHKSFDVCILYCIIDPSPS